MEFMKYEIITQKSKSQSCQYFNNSAQINMKYQNSPENVRKFNNRNIQLEKYNRSSNSQLSMTPDRWKSHLANDQQNGSFNRLRRSSSNKIIAGFRSPPRFQNQENQPHNFNTNDHAQKKKDEIMRRVKEIQEKVLPILKSDHRRTTQDEDISWQNRVEEKILRLETHVDELEKSMKIQLERRILEVETKWQKKLDEFFVNYKARTLEESDQISQPRRIPIKQTKVIA